MLVAEASIAKVSKIPLDVITNILINKIPGDLMSLQQQYQCPQDWNVAVFRTSKYKIYVSDNIPVFRNPPNYTQFFQLLLRIQVNFRVPPCKNPPLGWTVMNLKKTVQDGMRQAIHSLKESLKRKSNFVDWMIESSHLSHILHTL